MSRRLVIAIDCDDVLIASTEYLVHAYNDKYGTEVTLERAHESGNEEWGTDRITTFERLSELQSTEEYGLLKPLDVALEAVQELAQDHELHLITARHSSVEAVTLTMLDTYLQGCFKSIEHVGNERPKGEVSQRLGADVLIDDNVRHLMSALEHGLRPGGAIHFGAYPWNSSVVLPDGAVQCNDWSAVVKEINFLAGR